MERRDRLIARARQGFRMAYGVEPTRLYAAPGRLNLMGDHIEQHDGIVLPCAINRDTIVALGPAGDDEGATVDVVAIDMGGARDRFSASGEIEPGENNWQNFARGVAETLRRNGHHSKPCRIAIAGDIPIGVGLSSSGSLSVALTLAISDYSGLGLLPDAIASIALEAEGDFVGNESGLLDTLVAACGEAGHALLLDCQTHQHMPIPIAEGLTIAAIESGVPRDRSGDKSIARRKECARATEHYHVKTLRELTPEHAKEWRGDLDKIAYARTRHVVGEIARAEPMAVALVKGDTAELARIMRASHVSLRDDFEVSDPQIDRLVDIVAAALGDRGGVRLTGNGIGGCVVALLADDAVDQLVEAVEERYNQPGQVPAKVELLRASGGAAHISKG
ncbi:MAG: galactokinase [Pseudomonadota bacterium]